MSVNVSAGSLKVDGLSVKKFDKLMWPDFNAKKSNFDKVKDLALVIFARFKNLFKTFHFETNRSLLIHVLNYIEEERKKSSLFTEPAEVTKLYDHLFNEVVEEDPLNKQLIALKFVDVLRKSATPSFSVSVSAAGVNAQVNTPLGAASFSLPTSAKP